MVRVLFPIQWQMAAAVEKSGVAIGLVSVVLLLVQGPRVHAQKRAVQYAPTPTEHNQAIEKSRRLLTELMDAQGIPGLMAAVAVDGKLVWSEGFGYADVENKTPTETDTRMRVGSISKSLTSAALGLLVESGKLDLDAPVRRYVPSFPKKRYTVTPRHLAGNLSGIRHYREGEFGPYRSEEKRPYDSVQAGLSLFEEDSLLFEPGRKYHYSSYGWNLLSAVVEGASGQSFLSYMREHVFRPLDMKHTIAEHADSLIPNRARFYEQTPAGGLENAPYVNVSYKWAGGGFLSSAEDLVRFGLGMTDRSFLERQTRDLLFTSQKTASGRKTGYGYGWFVGEDWYGRTVVSHTGGLQGSGAVLVLYPEQDVAVALVENVNWYDAPMNKELGQTIAEFFHPPPKWRAAPDRAPKVPDGTYRVTLLEGDSAVHSVAERGLAGPRPFGDPVHGVMGRSCSEGPCSTWLVRKDHDRTVPIVHEDVVGGRLRLVGVDRRGVINLWLERTGERRLEGRWYCCMKWSGAARAVLQSQR